MMIGQKIVVVGGTAGIGLAVARNAADCGAEVYIGSSNAQKLESTLSAVQGVRGALVDVGNEESVAHFFSGISEIDHLVSTVGTSHQPAPVTETQLEEAQALYKIKFWGQFLIAKHGAPKVQHNGSLTSGILSARPVAGLGVLASVNAGIEALVRTLALELAPRRVNTVCPGFIDSGKLWKNLPAEAGGQDAGQGCVRSPYRSGGPPGRRRKKLPLRHSKSLCHRPDHHRRWRGFADLICFVSIT